MLMKLENVESVARLIFRTDLLQIEAKIHLMGVQSASVQNAAKDCRKNRFNVNELLNSIAQLVSTQKLLKTVRITPSLFNR